MISQGDIPRQRREDGAEALAIDRSPIIDRNFTEGVGRLREGPARDRSFPLRPGSRLTGAQAIDLFEAQLGNRHLDLAARTLRGRGQGFYTIGSSGHEGNAAVAAALRPDDPAFLHYRSGGFFLARGRQVFGQLPLFEVLLGLTASSDDPISGGRHKVFGSLALRIPPQTSTIGGRSRWRFSCARAAARAGYWWWTRRAGAAVSRRRSSPR